MIEGLPHWINGLFLLTVGITILLFYFANGKRKDLLIVLLGWSALQSALALAGFLPNHRYLSAQVYLRFTADRTATDYRPVA